MTSRHIFCRSERAAFSAICEVTTTYGAQVFPHLRIKEVANRSWINEETFDYALKGHIDFTIAMDFKPVLAIELDGRFHQSTKAKERDGKKDAICDELEIPLVRLDYGFMRHDLAMPVLKELVNTWLCEDHLTPPRKEPTHRYTLVASSDHIHTTNNYCRNLLGITEQAPIKFKVETANQFGGYAEASVKMSFGKEEIEIGRGRSKVPKHTLFCGSRLAEMLAIAQAGHYLRTADSTIRDDGSADDIAAGTSPAIATLESACASCNATNGRRTSSSQIYQQPLGRYPNSLPTT